MSRAAWFGIILRGPFLWHRDFETCDMWTNHTRGAGVGVADENADNEADFSPTVGANEKP